MRGLLVALVLVASTRAFAQSPAEKATVLFEEGRAARDAGKLDEACAKFDQSLALDRQLGTMLNLADCRESQGKLIEAHALFAEAIDLAVQGDKKVRETYARQHADALVKKLARVTLHAGAAPGLAVQLDGKDVTAELAKQRLVLPGKIIVTASATGQPPTRIERDVAAGSEQTIEISFTPIAIERKPAVAVTHGRSKLPWLVGGGGLALIAVSGMLAVTAKSAYDDAVADNAKDTDARIDKAQHRADIATGVGVAGVIAVTVGVVLYVRDRRGGVVVAPTVQRDGAGVSIGRSF